MGTRKRKPSYWVLTAAFFVASPELGCLALYDPGIPSVRRDGSADGGPSPAPVDLAESPHCSLTSPRFTRREFSSGYPLLSVHTADLDHDGNPDLIMSGDNHADLTIMFGDGKGGGTDVLVTELLYPWMTGVRPYAGTNRVIAADLDVDGQQDLVVAANGPYAVNVLPSSGARVFGDARAMELDHDPSGLAVGNFNDDGYPDLVISTAQSPTVSLSLGSVTGLTAPIAIPAAGVTGDLVVGDFDRDGFADVATTLPDQNQVQILFGSGHGTFPKQAQYSVGQRPQALVVSDFNRDGNLDLATANLGDNTVSILIAKGVGAFAPAVNLATPAGPVALASGDLGCDHFPELVVANFVNNTLHIFVNDGSGILSPLPPMPVAKYPSSVTIADFDHDGTNDIIMASKGTARVSVYLNRSF